MKTTAFALAGFAAAALLAGCGSDQATSAGSGAAQRIAPAPAKVVRRDIVGYELLQGQLYVPPDDQADVRAPYSGTVKSVLASVGQRVGRGEVLAQLDLPNAEGYYQQARAAVQAAEAAYASAKAQYEAPVRQAEQQLAQARSTERTIRAQSTPVDATGLQDAVAARQAAEQAVQQAKADYKTNMLTYQSQLDQARAALKAGMTNVKLGQISAPISGTVLALNVQPGGTVGQGDQPVARIVDLGAIEVKADVSPAQAALVKEDTPVVLTFQGVPNQTFDGRVASVRTLPGQGGAVRREATISFKNDQGLVKPDSKLQMVGVRTGAARNVLAVPSAAVTTDASGKPIVRVLRGQNWTPVVVETGLTDGTYTEIKSGLQEGETVQVPAARA